MVQSSRNKHSQNTSQRASAKKTTDRISDSASTSVAPKISSKDLGKGSAKTRLFKRLYDLSEDRAYDVFPKYYSPNAIGVGFFVALETAWDRGKQVLTNVITLALDHPTRKQITFDFSEQDFSNAQFTKLVYISQDSKGVERCNANCRMENSACIVETIYFRTEVEFDFRRNEITRLTYTPKEELKGRGSETELLSKKKPPTTIQPGEAEFEAKKDFRIEFTAVSTAKEICSLVIAARKRAGISQTELAQRMGTSQRVISRIETGESPPTYKTLIRIAEATGSKLIIGFEPK